VFEEVIEKSAAATSYMNDIVTASKEQSDRVVHITNALAEMDSSSRQSASQATQLAQQMGAFKTNRENS